MRFKPILLLFLVGFVLTSCRGIRIWQPGSSEYYSIIRVSKTDRKKALQEYLALPVNRQIDTFLYGVKYVEPNDVSIGEFLVLDGCQKLPSLYERIEGNSEEIDRAYLMEIVEQIDEHFGCVEVSDVERLSRAGADLNNYYHRQRFAAALDRLREKKGR